MPKNRLEQGKIDYFKKLFFLLRQTNKQKEIPINFSLTKNQKKTRELRIIKIKLATNLLINGQLLSQQSSNYLAHFFKNSINEVNTRFLVKSPLGQNLLLYDSENLWNNFVGIKQERLSTFYLVNRYPSKKMPGVFHMAMRKKFKRTKYRSFHINDLVFRMWISRQYSISNFYNKERRFSFYYGEEFLKIAKKLTWYGKGYGDFISSLEEAFCVAVVELQFLIYRSKALFKKFLMELLQNNSLMAKNVSNLIPSIVSSFQDKNLEYESKPKLIMLPKIFEVENPLTYKARKFGRQSIKSQIKVITETGGYSFPFPINLRTKKGLYSGQFSHQHFNQNYYRVKNRFVLDPKQIYFHDWWKTIAIHKSDVGLNRQYAICPNTTTSPIISKKDILFQTLFENKTFYCSAVNSSSLIKGKRIENFLVRQFFSKKTKKTKKNVSRK